MLPRWLRMLARRRPATSLRCSGYGVVLFHSAPCLSRGCGVHRRVVCVGSHARAVRRAWCGVLGRLAEVDENLPSRLRAAGVLIVT
jgi:hypothetical protein